MTGRLAGKRAFITAAAAGIGRATTLAFVREGASVTATDIDEKGLASLAAETGVKTFRLDATDAGQVAAAAAGARDTDILFNCVGWVPAGTILECDDAQWTRAIALTMTTTFRMMQAFLPAMLEKGGGSIVNVGSVISSITGSPNRFAYGTTKAAVIGMTKSVAAEYVKQGIRCNVICPATIDTPSLADRIAATGDAVAGRAAFIARQPMGRFGTPEEVAALAVYLASDESAFTTGQAHVIDGGWNT